MQEPDPTHERPAVPAAPAPPPPPDGAGHSIAYEAPDQQRPASSAPTEHQLEYESPGAARAHDPYAALRSRNYRLYSLGWVVAVMGQEIQSVAVGWEVYQKTGKELSLGWVGLVQALPVLLLSLPAGQLADRLDRRAIVRVCLLLAVAATAGLFFVSQAGKHVGLMYACLGLNAVATSIAWPARSSLLPQIVPPESFNNAVTWNSSFFQVASGVGPLLGGWIVALWGPPTAYAVDAACILFFIVMIGLLRVRPVERTREPVTWASLAAGVRFVWRTKIILATITLDLLAVLLGGSIYLLPAVAKDILHVGPVGLGWLQSSPAIGAFLAALLMAHLPPMKRAGWAMIWAVAGFGAATVVFGLSRSYWLSFLALALTGAFDNVSVVVRHTLVQILPPDRMRGRVSAVNNIFIGTSNKLGGFESGLVAQLTSTATSIIAGGIGTVLVVILVALKWPQVRRFGSLQEAKPIDEDPPADAAGANGGVVPAAAPKPG